MVGHESEVVTWNLKKGRDWPLVKASVRVEGHVLELVSSASALKYVSLLVGHSVISNSPFQLAIVCGTANQFPFAPRPSAVTLSFPSILFPRPWRRLP